MDSGQHLPHCFPVSTRSGHRASPISYAWQGVRFKWGLLQQGLLKPFFSTSHRSLCTAPRRVQSFLFAENGKDAIKIIGSQPVDMVILDWSVPAMPGIDTLRWGRTTDLPPIQRHHLWLYY